MDTIQMDDESVCDGSATIVTSGCIYPQISHLFLQRSHTRAAIANRFA
jgi:hypothetical protein